MIFVGISGKRGSGKSLLASYLEHYQGFTRFSLADELKKEVMRDWGLMPIQLWGKDKETPTKYTRTDGSPLTPRDIMIRHGIYRRSIDPLYFCKKFDPRIGDRIVCDDLRFKNELSFFTQWSPKFVRIERSAELNVFKAAIDDFSETELDSFKAWDYTLPAERNIHATDLKKFAEHIALSL